MAFQPASRLERTPRQTRRDAALDLALAVVAFALTLAVLRQGNTAATHDLDGLGIALAALASLPLVVAHRAPLAVFVVTALASAVLNLLDYASGPPFGPTIALFFIALAPERMRTPRPVGVAVAGALLLVHAGADGLADESFPTVPLLWGTLVWGGAWVIGDRVRERRARIAELEERARRAERDAERERRLAAAEERTRIARDLHDSAGHAINVILVQAGAARLLGEQDPGRARGALETIEEVARETLGEIDQLVGALREESDGNVEPPLGLAGVATLAERHRSAGLDVSVRSRGDQRAVSPGLDQAAYRILQEALTNAARHGGGSANVDVGYGARALELAVTNPTRPGAPTGDAGHGIVGMRERAALLGGTLEAGARDGAFRVVARLPYAADGQ
jgi:signal transduction histidine kinase